MKKLSRLLYYLLFGAGVILIDRLTKAYALSSCMQECKIASFLSFFVTFNRGISFGMLHSTEDTFFMVLSLVVIGITLFLAAYAYARVHRGFAVFGETMVIAGSISNIIDRIFYGSVVDFIMFHGGNFTFPVFNIADMCIVIGIGLMLLFYYKYDE